MAPTDRPKYLYSFVNTAIRLPEHDEEGLQDFEHIENPTALILDDQSFEESNLDYETDDEDRSLDTTTSTISSTPEGIFDDLDYNLKLNNIRKCLFPPSDDDDDCHNGEAGDNETVGENSFEK